MNRLQKISFVRHGLTYLALLIAMFGASRTTRAEELSPNAELFSAAAHVDSAAIDRALARGASLEARNDSGDTPLLFVIKNGGFNNSYKSKELLLKRGANPNVLNRQGVPALFVSSQADVPSLIRYGADVNTRDKEGQTRLMWEVKATEEDLVRFLLEHKADPNLSNNKGETPLMLTYPQYVPLLLKHGADVNLRDKSGETVLMRYIWNGDRFARRNSKTVALLLQKGADIHLAHPKGSAVERAAKYVNADIVRAMLKDLSLTASERKSLEGALISDDLFGAANLGNARLTSDLLARGADPNVVLNDAQYDDDGLTPFLICAQRLPKDEVTREVAKREEKRDIEVARALIQSGATLDDGAYQPVSNQNGYSALQFAAQLNKPDLARFLLQEGANPNKVGHGGTALFSAVSNSLTTRILLRGGANPNVRIAGGQTALLQAARFGSVEVVQMLLARGADPNAKLDTTRYSSYETTSTPLIAAVRHFAYNSEQDEAMVQRESIEITQMLLRAGARINERDQAGQTALLIAAAYGNRPVARVLLRAGADTEVKDEKGQTPLMAACAGRYIALTSAAGAGLLPPNPDIAEMLLQRRADPNARDKDGSTALISATRYDWRHNLWRAISGNTNASIKIRKQWASNAVPAKRCLEVLLRHGANPNLRDNKGHSARDWAKAKGNRDMARLLEAAEKRA